MKFKYFDHTADAMFEAYGKNMEEAFENCALAMFNLLTDIEKVKPLKMVLIEVDANTLEKLLFDFLDELLFYLDTKHIVFCKFENVKIENKDGFKLSCKAQGDDISKYRRHGDIKAPTYNEMKITQDEKKVTIRAVVDI